MAHFSHDVFSYFLSPALPFIIKNLGISYSQAGLLSIFHRLPALLNPLIGSYASRKSPVIIIAAAITVTAAAMSFITAAPTYLILAMLILTMGISACFFHIPAPVLIRKYSGSNIGTGMSFYMFGGELARTAGPVVIIAAMAAFGAGRVYYLVPFAVLMSLIVILKFRKSEKKDKSSADQKHIEEGFLKLVGENKFFLFSFFVILISRAAIASVLNAFVPAYLTGQGYTIWRAGIMLSVLQFAAALGTLTAGYISDKAGNLNVIKVITAISPFLMILFIYSSGIYKIIFMVMTGFFAFSSPPVIMAYFQKKSGKNSTLFSTFYMMLNFITISIMLVFTGFAADFAGLQNAFLASSFAAMAGIPFTFVLGKMEKQNLQKETGID